MPLGTDEELRLTKQLTTHPHLWLDWVTGAAPPTLSGGHAKGIEAWHRNAETIWLFQTLRIRQDDVHSATSERSGVDSALLRLADHRQRMERAGLSLPALPDDWSTRITELARRERSKLTNRKGN
ncbi:MAG: hypothetical protein ABIQ73_27490 [Acidimicrobiales bacterium]